METKKAQETEQRASVEDASHALDDVRELVKQHPYGAMAAAAGAGYVLAGGLFTRLTARLLKIGVRVSAPLAAWSLLGKALVNLADVLEAEGATPSTPVRSRLAANDAHGRKNGAVLPG
jgi:hypothetical protein